MPDFSQLPEVFVSNGSLAKAISKEVKLGRLRRLASRVYSRNLSEDPGKLVLRHLWPLVDALMPGALIADRTALENQPASDGSVFLISNHKRDIQLPGITLRARKGPCPLDNDRYFVGTLRLASPARAFLENLRSSRARNGVARTLSKTEIEERLDEMLRAGGEEAIQKLRDNARVAAAALAMPEEFAALDRLIGGLLGSRQAKMSSPLAVARAAGVPYDPARLELFQNLFTALESRAAATRPAPESNGPALPFFEAYFSNFIEGTEFAVDEAAEIVFAGRLPTARPEDAHDVLGTWKVVSDSHEMSRRPRNGEEFIELLRARHARVMEGRPGMGPGTFKTEANRAGGTMFVAPDLVQGTLRKGFDIYRGIAAPLHRAIFMMFVVAEVHPFTDGNGRVARIMMNAELVAARECRIVVPTVFRNNYLAALKALSQNGFTEPLFRALDFAQRFTASVDFASLESARRGLEASNAFKDPNEAEASGIRLRLADM